MEHATLTTTVETILRHWGLSPQVIVLLLAAAPVAELRGAIPIGLFALGLPLGQTVWLSVVGNLLPVIPLYYGYLPVSRWLNQHTALGPLVNWMTVRAARHARLLERWEAFGLALFIGVPLPGTGVWTGCLAAALVRLPLRLTCAACVGGVVAAAGIVTALCLGIHQLF